MFNSANFNQDISTWDISSLKYSMHMFYASKFDFDVSAWASYKLKNIYDMFSHCKAPIPYWAEIEDQEERNTAIEKYNLHKELNKNLAINGSSTKRIKI
jgi:hypothetical protein